MGNNTTSKNNSAAVVIQPNKRHKWQIVLIGPVGAIENNNIAESLVVKPGLTITPEQSLQMIIFINQVSEEKTWISLFPRHHVTDHSLSITVSNCFLLVLMAEIINVPCRASNLIETTALHAQYIHDFVFADPSSFHLYNVRFLLGADSSM
jgi:hypothetical protein